MTTLVFPGQGSQFIGMSKDFYDNFDTAKKTFEEIEDYSNINLKDIIFNGMNNSINETKFTQISIFAASLIIYKTLINETNINFQNINVMMGHSLGEYTALACSDKISLKDCSDILTKRGKLMNEAVEPNKSGMAALIGENAVNIQKIIDENNLDLQIANDNSPIQVVVSGDMDILKHSKDIFIKNKIKKYVVLNVSAAFHSKFMKEAEKKLNDNIETIKFNESKISIISNYSANISNESKIIKKSLQNQMSNKVRWVESIKKLEEIGEKEIVEIGPGKVLSGLIKRISNKFDIKSINEINDLKLYE